MTNYWKVASIAELMLEMQIQSNVTTEISKIINNTTVVARGRLTDSFIHDLDVSPEYRRQGFAQEIVRGLIQLGGKRLWVKSTNSAAIRLYEKLGFKAERYEEGYYLMGLDKKYNS